MIIKFISVLIRVTGDFYRSLIEESFNFNNFINKTYVSF